MKRGNIPRDAGLEHGQKQPPGQSVDKSPPAQGVGAVEGATVKKSGMIAIKDIKTHPTFVDLLPVAEDLLERLIQNIRTYGFFPSSFVVLAIWKGLAEPVLIDGHMRVRAAAAAGITEVPFVLVELEDEMQAVERAAHLQTERRATTDGALYRLCAQYDKQKDRGRPRKGEQAGKLTSRVVNFVGPSASARKTAQRLGCNYKKVDKIRKIRKDGSPEIQDDVRNDRIRINKAYKLIRDVELGTDETRKKSRAAQIRAAKTLCTEESFAILQDLDGDIGAHVNAAVELYIERLHREEESAAESET